MPVPTTRVVKKGSKIFSADPRDTFAVIGDNHHDVRLLRHGREIQTIRDPASDGQFGCLHPAHRLDGILHQIKKNLLKANPTP